MDRRSGSRTSGSAIPIGSKNQTRDPLLYPWIGDPLLDRGWRSTFGSWSAIHFWIVVGDPLLDRGSAISDGLNEVDHTYGRSWKKRSEDTWRLTLTYPKIRIGDIIGFGTFWLVNTIINRVQFASNNTSRLLFQVEFLGPRRIEATSARRRSTLEVWPGRELHIYSHCDRTQEPTKIVGRPK